MFKIGDFSKFSRVTIKMLRHYDEIGLLKPAHVDPFTSYRYYTADQLPRLNRIIALKDLGFSLEQISTLLDDDLPTSEIHGMLKLKRAEIERRVQAELARLAQVEARIAQINVPYEVVLRQIAPQMVATIREVVPGTGKAISRLFERVETHVAKHHARQTAPPLMIYHDPDYRENEIDVEVAVPVSAVIPGDEQVRVRELAGCSTMACVIHTGSYAVIQQAFNALFAWIDTHDYQITGASREVYLRFGADNEGYTVPDAYLTDNADEFVTELQIPVSKRSE